MTTDKIETLYTISEVAQKLHKSETSVCRWITEGKLEYIQVSPRRRVVSATQMVNFLDSRTMKGPVKLVDSKSKTYDSSCNCSLTTENEDLDVESLEKEIKRLCQ